MKKKAHIAVIGGHRCSKKIYAIAYETGRLIARQGWILICGGGPGVMEAACRGAKAEGGTTVGILPSYDGKEANEYLDVSLTTGLGYARNVLVVRSADAIVAIGGSYGTLSEIAFAFNDPKQIIGIETWQVDGLKQVKTPQEVLKYLKNKIGKNPDICSTNKK